LVVDGEDQALSDVTVKARSSSTVTDQRGCFQMSEMTYPHKHEMPFRVTASGFKPFVGALAAPGVIRVRVTLADDTSNTETVVDSSPEPGGLGVCEPPRREVGHEVTAEGGFKATTG
jgi:hypothetical protein